MHTPENIKELRALTACSTPLSYRFFLDYQPSANGILNNACLSQWWPCQFTVNHYFYTSAEHFMMHQKALLFGDQETAERILDCDHPFRAKMLGRAVHPYDDQRWCAARFELVIKGNIAKFEQNELLLRFLLATGNDILAETSPTDTIWGTGCSSEDAIAPHPEKWPGQNLLGFALMQARTKLRRLSTCATLVSTTSA